MSTNPNGLMSLPESVLERIFHFVCPVTKFGEEVKIVARDPVLAADGTIPLRGMIADIMSSYERGESNGHPWNPLSLCRVNRRFAHLIPQWALKNVEVDLTKGNKLPAMVKFLTSAPYGCGDAHRTSYAKSLKISSSYTGIKFPAVDLRTTFERATALTRLCLGSDFYHSRNTNVGVAMFNCPNLISLKIVHQHLVPKSFYSSLAQPNVLPQLQHLKVSLGYDSSKAGHLTGLGQGVAGSGLKSLSLSSHTIPDSRYASVLFSYLGQLQKLKLEIEVVDEEMSYVSPKCCSAIAKRCGNVKELAISGLDDATLELLAADVNKNKKGNNNNNTNFFRTSVETISVYHCFVTPACIPTLRRFPNLKAFKIEYSGRFKEVDVVKFDQALPGAVTVSYYGTELGRFCGSDDDDDDDSSSGSDVSMGSDIDSLYVAEMLEHEAMMAALEDDEDNNDYEGEVNFDEDMDDE